MKGLLLIAAALACAAAPAPARTDAGGSFTAVDFAFRANGTTATTLTIAPGETVSFSYPEGNSTHNVDFTGDRKPDCTGLPPFPYPPRLWTPASCRFDQPGTYPFVCDLHAEMTGTVVVAVPTPSPTPTPTPTPTADPIAPGATPTPTPGPEASSTPGPQPATLSLKLATRQ
jgi:plastocyanin